MRRSALWPSQGGVHPDSPGGATIYMVFVFPLMMLILTVRNPLRREVGAHGHLRSDSTPPRSIHRAVRNVAVLHHQRIRDSYRAWTDINLARFGSAS